MNGFEPHFPRAFQPQAGRAVLGLLIPVRPKRAGDRRVDHLRSLLISGTPFNANTVAKALKASAKTIHRDIKWLSKDLKVSIKFDAHRNAYFLKKLTQSRKGAKKGATK